MIELSNVESHNLFHFPFYLDRRPSKIESNSKGEGGSTITALILAIIKYSCLLEDMYLLRVRKKGCGLRIVYVPSRYDNNMWGLVKNSNIVT